MLASLRSQTFYVNVVILPSFYSSINKNRTGTGKIQLFNGEDIMFLCAEIEGKVW